MKHVTVVVGEYHLLEKETNPEPEKIINVKSIFNHENFTKVNVTKRYEETYKELNIMLSFIE